jgi:small subunit ribosomal protein S6
MPYYENVFITRQDASAAQVEQLAEAFAGIITANGGTVTKKEFWGLRNLSYKINKNRKGHYTLLNIDAPAPAVQEMERNMRINEDVLRYLTVRVETLEEGPSAMLQSRNREGREGREGRERDRGERFGERPRRERFGDRGERSAAPDETHAPAGSEGEQA